jgi:hypothetical protein
MAGENGNGAPHQPVGAQVEAAAELVIKMDRQGNVSVSGPIENRMLCYSMMEMARDAIYEYAQANKGDRRIVVPPSGLRIVG